jgi:hypothetical protein
VVAYNFVDTLVFRQLKSKTEAVARVCGDRLTMVSSSSSSVAGSPSPIPAELKKVVKKEKKAKKDKKEKSHKHSKHGKKPKDKKDKDKK